jgi:aspartate kinase
MKRSIVVMKFGGTSVKNTERLKAAAERIVETQQQRKSVVVVVSAPGDMTDDLIEKARAITNDPDGRELDMLLATGEQVSIALLCMAVKNHGVEAISLTGPQAGIRADHVHTKARITDIKPKKLIEELKKGKVVVVAGFQGLNPKDDITTLGHGGSDLTAVALAAALKSDVCEIYTDVTGVFTTDPRVVPDAQKIDQISYDENLVHCWFQCNHQPPPYYRSITSQVLRPQNTGSNCRRFPSIEMIQHQSHSTFYLYQLEPQQYRSFQRFSYTKNQ